MRGICLALAASMLISAQMAGAQSLKGEVSATVTPDLQESTANNPPAEALLPSEGEPNQNLSGLAGSSIDNSQLSRQFQGSPRAFVRVMQMSGNSDQLNQLIAERRSQHLRGDAQQQLSCIGICYEALTGSVIKVLPGSDLYGNVFPGDRLVAEDGVNPLDSWQAGRNFGQAGSVTNITVIGRNGLQTIACHRKPISELMPGYEGALNWAALSH